MERAFEALKNRVDEEDKGVADLSTPGGTQGVTIINESGLYILTELTNPNFGGE